MEDVESGVLGGMVCLDDDLQNVQIITNVKQNIEHSYSTLKTEYFSDEKNAKIYSIILECYLQHHTLLDEALLRSKLQTENQNEDAISEYLIVFRSLSILPKDHERFKYIASNFKKSKLIDRLKDGILDASQGIKDGKVEAATESLQKTIQELTAEGNENIIEELSKSAEDVVKNYHIIKISPKQSRVYSGFQRFDSVTSGWQPGELIIGGGYAAQGKSQFILNSIYHNAVVNHKNTVVVSLEMPILQYSRRLLSRHSLHPKFEMSDTGIPYGALKNGTLTPPQERILEEIRDDLANNTEYGKIFIAQMKRGSTVDDVYAVAMNIASRNSVDLIAIDYLTLLSPLRKRHNFRDEVSDIVKDAKQMALTFNKGKGVPVLAVTQISRAEYQKALQNGVYSIISFAESSELERSADAAFWLLRREEEIKNKVVKVGICKYRDNAAGQVFYLSEDFSRSFLGDTKYLPEDINISTVAGIV